MRRVFFSLRMDTPSYVVPTKPGFGAAPRNCGRRIAGRDACPPEREESASPAPAAFPSTTQLAGSMVTVFPAVGSSTPSALFRQMSRSPLLFRKLTTMPLRLSASTLLRSLWEKLLGVRPSAPSGSIFSSRALAGAQISGAPAAGQREEKASARRTDLPDRSHPREGSRCVFHC